MTIPEEIIAVAKGTMLRFGGIRPMLFVLGTKNKIFTQLPMGENSTERVSIMTEAGTNLAKFNDVGDVELVVFVSEAWTSPARTPMVMPSQDPNRKEVLVISALDAKTDEQTLQMFSCIRDRNEVIVELKRIALPVDVKAEGPLLRSFLAGYRLFKK